MYAVVQTGGKQYLVREGDQLLLEKLPGKASEKITFEDVLFIEKDGKHMIGQPTVSGAQVVASIIDQEKGPKITIFKFRRRKNSKRKTGHRQELTRIKIESIKN
jgi:large subunit ribosomal protein L21